MGQTSFDKYCNSVNQHSIGVKISKAHTNYFFAINLISSIVTVPVKPALPVSR